MFGISSFRKDSEFTKTSSILLRMVLVGLFVILLFEGQWLNSTAIAASIIISFLPSIVWRTMGAYLPWTLELAVILAFTLHAAGVAFDLYGPTAVNWVFFDDALHFLNTAILALVGFELAYALSEVTQGKITIPMIAILTFTTAITLGALWEVAEFSLDQLLGTQTSPSLADAMSDLCWDTMGALTAAILGSMFTRGQRKKTHGGSTASK